VSSILVILLAPLALALVVIALPFHAHVRGGVADSELSGILLARWAFGLLGVDLRKGGPVLRLAGLRVMRLRGRGRRARGEPRRPRAKGRAPRKAGKSPAARLRAAAANGGRLLGMGARLAGTLHLRLRLEGRVGTGDPADTAALAGLLRAAQALPGIDLRVDVDWLDEVLELEAEGSSRVWIPEVLVVAGLLLLRRGNRAAVRALAS
jgi:hypothetical protein